MAVVHIQEQPDMFTTDMYDAVNERMGASAQPPEGLLVHTLGRGDDGKWRIVDVWESQEAADRFREERLLPALHEIAREAGIDPADMPEPKTLAYKTHDVIAPAGAHAA
jgi:hypothetical protein